MSEKKKRVTLELPQKLFIDADKRADEQLRSFNKHVQFLLERDLGYRDHSIQKKAAA
jgi:hypothetical protein